MNPFDEVEVDTDTEEYVDPEVSYEDEVLASAEVESVQGEVVPDEEDPEQSLETQQARAERAKILENLIKSDLLIGREAFWDLGQRLFEFHEMNGHTALGYETQEEFLAQPDVGIKRSVYFKAVRRHRDLVQRRLLPAAMKETDDNRQEAEKLVRAQLSQLDPSKVDIVIPTITSKTNTKTTEEILSDVQSMGASDLYNEYVTKPKGGAAVDDDDVIEGSETVDPEKAKAREEAKKAREAFQTAVLTVDSWLEMGGDRRKAQRSWVKMEQGLEAFQIAAKIKLTVEGAEDAPSKDEAHKLWLRFAKLLSLDLSAPTGA